MTRNIPVAFQTHLDGEYLTLATLWSLKTADPGQTFVFRELFFTDHDEDIPQGGDIYKASSGYTRAALSNRIEMNVDNTDVEIILDDLGLDPIDIRNGVWDNAEVVMKLVNYTNVANGVINLRQGTLGEIKMIDSQQAIAELRGLMQKLSVNLADVYTPDCRADLGDGFDSDGFVTANGTCFLIFDPPFWKANTFYTQRALHEGDNESDSIVKPTRFNDRHFISFELIGTETSGATEPSWNLTIGGETIDNDVKWVTFQARTIEGVVATVTSLRKFTITYTGDAPDAFLQDGVCKIISGPNKDARKEVKKWTLSSKTVELFLPLAVAVEVGDRVEIRAGCDKTVPECRDTFDLMHNFRGEPYVPGANVTLNFPDAR